MTEWMNYLKKFYQEKKATDQTYSYKNAMKDAAKSYKSNTSSSMSTSKKSKKSKSMKRKSVRKGTRRK